MKQEVRRIERIVAGARTHSVSLGEHQSFEKRLDLESTGGELAGEIIQQFRVCRPFAEDAEVIGAGNYPAAEEVVPEAIDRDAGQVWIALRIDDLPGEFEAASAVIVLDTVRSKQGLQPAVRHDLAERARIAANEDGFI